jgi:PTH1 family peptidyl-tRNA hydrolase
MDLPFGRLRLRLSGSAGGHNGMKSIISHIGGQNFPRLRLGIGKSGGKSATVGYVLGKFSSQEKPVLSELMTLTEDAIVCSLKEGVEKAMSLYNQKQVQVMTDSIQNY